MQLPLGPFLTKTPPSNLLPGVGVNGVIFFLFVCFVEVPSSTLVTVVREVSS